MLEVRYRPRAELDIHSAVLYLGEVLGNPVAARKLYETLVEAIERLRSMPTLGRAFSDDRLEGKDYRSFLVGNYRVFYSFTESELTVWRVVHVRQDIADYEIVGW